MSEEKAGDAGHLTPASIVDRRRVYEGWSRLDVLTVETQVRGRSVRLRREVHDHGHGAAVLAFDAGRRTAILVRQIRAGALVVDGSGVCLEAIAGLVDPGEDAETTVRREAWEEAGVVIGEAISLGMPYSTPGAVTERLALYLGEIDPAAERGAGGGLVEENEEIEVVELPLAELACRADAGRLDDLKTLFLVEALRRRRPDLFV